MILSIGGIKGGSGKTTLAVNVAVAKAIEGKKVLLVDADDQKSALTWSEARDSLETSMIADAQINVVHLSGSSVLTQVKKLSKDYDEVIIDVGGRETASLRAALLVCDIFLTPFRPRSLDIWTIEKIEEILLEAQIMNPSMKAFSILNQADSRGSDNKDAKQILKDSNFIMPMNCIISQRKVFANAISEGLGILEYTPIDKKAEIEIKKMISKLYKYDIG